MAERLTALGAKAVMYHWSEFEDRLKEVETGSVEVHSTL
jgi:hypothetical protein